MERANTDRKGRQGRSIESIPEFQSHLMRERLTFPQWEARNKVPLAADDSLSLTLRYKYSKTRPRR